MNSPTSKQKLITSVVTLFAIALLVTGAHFAKVKTTTSSAAPAASTAPTTASSQTSPGKYKDGMYMASGSYSSPGGTQNIAVSLTLAGNKVTDASVKPSADSGVAQIYQSYFVKGYKTYVVGKDVDKIKLSRVSGSSLTSKGFNDALQKIKQQAS